MRILLNFFFWFCAATQKEVDAAKKMGHNIIRQ